MQARQALLTPLVCFNASNVRPMLECWHDTPLVRARQAIVSMESGAASSANGLTDLHEEQSSPFRVAGFRPLLLLLMSMDIQLFIHVRQRTLGKSKKHCSMAVTCTAAAFTADSTLAGMLIL